MVEWCDGAGYISIAVRPTIWISVGQGPTALAVGAGRGGLDIFTLIYLSPSLWETARYRLKYCLKGPLNPKQPANQPTLLIVPVIYMYVFLTLTVFLWSIGSLYKHGGGAMVLGKLPVPGRSTI